MAEKKDGKPPVVGAFIVPNEPIGYDKKLTDYQVSSFSFPEHHRKKLLVDPKLQQEFFLKL